MKLLLLWLVIIWWLDHRKTQYCLDYGGYGPYDDGDSFGYKDWVCELPRGHRGNHFAQA